MDTSNGAETPQPASPTSPGRDSDGSTVCGSEYEKKDLESQSVRPVDRSLSHYLGFSSPVNDNLDDIAEEDLADSECGETADVEKLDYQQST